MTSSILIAIATGAGLAAASSAHCAVMCGPLSLATRVRQGAGGSAWYLVGRFAGYAAAGAVSGGAGRLVLASGWARGAELALSWLLAIALACTGVRMLRGAERAALLPLGTRPRFRATGRVLARVADDPLLLGAATALLPCGALFSGLLAAASLGSALQGALAMGAFSLVSALVLVAVGSLGQLDLRHRTVRRTIGGALLVGAAIMAIRPLSLLQGEGAAPACHAVAFAPPGAGADGAAR